MTREEELMKIIADQQRRIERMEAANAVQNLIGRYVTYHAASDQEATIQCFCRHTPGIRLVFNGDIYDGWEGVLRHFVYRMANAEQDLSGRLYCHDVVSPVIEVAEDAQSAIAVFTTHGAETGWYPDGRLMALWSWGKYRFDCLKEDGEWRIYRLEFHQCMNTPYSGEGWVKEPCYDLIGNAPAELKDNEPENCKPHRKTKKPYLPLSTETGECDMHNMNPAPPMPYATYDFEGIKDEDDLDWHI